MAITKGGIAFTFYDSVNWAAFNSYYPIMQKIYPGWTATFYIDLWHTLSGTVKAQVLAAQAAGIQIGNHQYDPTPAVTYLATHTEEEFWTNMVENQQNNMIADGVTPTTFGFSGGGSTMPPRSVHDLILSKGSAIVSTVDYAGGIYGNVSEAAGYYKKMIAQGSGGIGHVDINSDSQRASFDLSFIISQLDYCKQAKDVYIHSGHRIEATPVAALSNLHSTIQKISHYCDCNDLNFYTMNDLIDAGFVGSDSVRPRAFINSLTGTQSSGNNLTATYIYQHDTDVAESGTTIQWYRADNAQGLNSAPIASATSLVYLLTGSDTGKFVRIGITTRTASEVGYETFSKWLTIS